MAGAEEGHHLVAHCVDCEGVGGGSGHVVANDEADDVFVFGGLRGLFVALLAGFELFLFDDLCGFEEDCAAGGVHVAVGLGWEEADERGESGETVDDAGRQVEFEAAAVGLSEGCVWVVETVDVGS